MTGKPKVNYGPALCAAGVPNMAGATYLLRLTVGNTTKCPRRLLPISLCAACVQPVGTFNGRRCYNSQSGEHRRSDFSPGDGAHGKTEVSKSPPPTSRGVVDNACLARRIC